VEKLTRLEKAIKRNRNINVQFYNGFYREDTLKKHIPINTMIDISMGYARIYLPVGELEVSYLRDEYGNEITQRKFIEDYGYSTKGSSSFGLKKEGKYIILESDGKNVPKIRFLVDWLDYQELLKTFN
jgi:hypothetical protein